jgi:hypothetical protein
MAKRPFSIPLRAVIYREGKWWIAHCLELDLVAEGPSPRRAFQDLMDLSLLQLRVAEEEGDLQSIFRPAPANVWMMFGKANPISTGRTPRLPNLIERFEARELQLVET